MATIIYTVNLNTPGRIVNFRTLYEENEESIKNITPTVVNNNKFYPLILKVSSDNSESNERRIYFHTREREKRHYVITTEQYQIYKSQIDVADVVIFINDEPDAPNEIEELKQYLHIN